MQKMNPHSIWLYKSQYHTRSPETKSGLRWRLSGERAALIRSRHRGQAKMPAGVKAEVAATEGGGVRNGHHQTIDQSKWSG